MAWKWAITNLPLCNHLAAKSMLEFRWSDVCSVREQNVCLVFSEPFQTGACQSLWVLLGREPCNCGLFSLTDCPVFINKPKQTPASSWSHIAAH